MKILLTIPGNLNTVPMNEYVPATLREMGHQVTVFNYVPRDIHARLLKRWAPDALIKLVDKRLIETVEVIRPDVFFTIFGCYHSPAVLEKIRSKRISTLCWWLNDPFQFERSMANAACYDFYFTNCSGSALEYKKRGIKEAYFLPVGIYPAVHKKIAGEPKKYDVCFAGDHKDIREQVLNELVKDFNVAIMGPWRKKLPKNSPLHSHLIGKKFFSAEEMIKTFNQSRIVLNIHTWFGKWDYGINPRVFEASGSGACQLCDQKLEIPELYKDGREIALYKTISELKEKITYYLANDEARATMGENALARSLQDHTYTKRMQEMFKIAGLA